MVHYHKEQKKQHQGSPLVFKAVGETVGWTCCHCAALCNSFVPNTAVPISAASLCVWLQKCTGPEHWALCVLRWETQSSSLCLSGCPHHRPQGKLYNILLWDILVAVTLFFFFYAFFSSILRNYMFVILFWSSHACTAKVSFIPE